MKPGVKNVHHTVLTQEVIRFNNLIKVFNRTLADLLKALKGLVVMSGELEAMADGLYTNQVPAVWTKVAYPSLKPLAAWVEDLVQRISFISLWEQKGAPASYWVSGFFFPQAFLTGTLQNYARKYTVAIDTVDFDFIVLQKEGPEISAKPEDGDQSQLDFEAAPAEESLEESPAENYEKPEDDEDDFDEDDEEEEDDE